MYLLLFEYQFNFSQLFFEKTYQFIIGAIVVFLLQLLWKFININWKKRKLSKLQGYWLEPIESLKAEKREYSIGHFYFDWYSDSFIYNGKNFIYDQDSWKPFYKWNSKVVYYDANNEQFYYIYQVQKYDSGKSIKFGFGVANIDFSSNACIFTNGFFVDAVRENPNIRFYKPINLKMLAKELNIQRKKYESENDFHSAIISEYSNRLSSNQ